MKHKKDSIKIKKPTTLQEYSTHNYTSAREINEIKSNVELNKSLKRALIDAKLGKGRLVE